MQGEAVATFMAYPPVLVSACPGIGESPACKVLDAAEARDGDFGSGEPSETDRRWSRHSPAASSSCPVLPPS